MLQGNRDDVAVRIQIKRDVLGQFARLDNRRSSEFHQGGVGILEVLNFHEGLELKSLSKNAL